MPLPINVSSARWVNQAVAAPASGNRPTSRGTMASPLRPPCSDSLTTARGIFSGAGGRIAVTGHWGARRRKHVSAYAAAIPTGAAPGPGGATPPDRGPAGPSGTGAEPTELKPEPRNPRRFYGSVEIDVVCPVKAFDSIVNAVVIELQRTQGAKVKLTLEIQAEAPNGFAEGDVGVVRDNAPTVEIQSRIDGIRGLMPRARRANAARGAGPEARKGGPPVNHEFCVREDQFPIPILPLPPRVHDARLKGKILPHV
jgi:hypothetical protein